MSDGKWFTIGGLLLLAAALCLTIYNIRDEERAADSSMVALQEYRELKAPAQSAEDAEASPDAVPEPTIEPILPDYKRMPHMPMPEEIIDGQPYIGVLTIPALELELPIISDWSYAKLKIGPCRYYGSAYLDNMVLFAHNYRRHFGSLSQAQPGDDVYFEDVDGNVFHYQVVDMETLNRMAVEDMVLSDWDLTLFTCTVGGTNRVAVRCDLASS